MSRIRGIVAFLILMGIIAANFVGPLKVQHLSIQIAAEPVARLGPLVITNTLLSSWLAMLVLVAVAVLASRQIVDTPKDTSLQNIVETGFEALLNVMQSMVGQQARTFFPVVATFFFFILTANWLSLLPGFGSIGFWEQTEGERLFVPLFRASTSDLSTTLALACCSVLSSQVYGIRALGFVEYSSRFVAVGKLINFFERLIRGGRPGIGLLLSGLLDVFIGLLELFDELVKVLSFAFRLFGNIFGGEVLLLVIAFLAPYVASLPFMALEVFGGFIQAVIFALLSTAFYGRAAASHSHLEDGDILPEPPEQSVTSR